jgi:tetratricopeptide (TPR) repeat protein
LAEHYIASENYEKGAEYCRLAGRKAEKAASFTDAIAYGEKRVACLERLPRKEEVKKKIIDARTTLGLYMTQLGYIFESKQAINPIVDLAIRMDYKKRLSQIYTIIGAYNYEVEMDIPETIRHLKKALKMAEEVNDVVSLVFANIRLGQALGNNCEFENARYHLERALDINVKSNSFLGIVFVKSYISNIIYLHPGMTNLSYQTSEEALHIAEESGDIYSKANAHSYHGMSSFAKGFFDKATEHLRKGVNFNERVGYFVMNSFALSWLGDTYFEIGEYQRSKDHYDKAIEILEQTRSFPSYMNLNKICLEKAKVMNNEKGIDLELLYGYEAENKVKIWKSSMRRNICEILLNIDDQHISEAEDWINKAIEADERNGMRWHLGRDYALYAELFRRKRDLSKAKENMNKAIEILEECGADGWVEKYEKELAALS